MELMIASKTKLPLQGNVDSTIVMQSVIRAILLEWRSEVVFLKKKAITIAQFMGLGYKSDRCFGYKKDYFQKEILQFVEEAFPLFQRKIEQHISIWSSNQFPHKNSFGQELNGFRTMQQEWQGLKQKFWQLELPIMEALFHNYPVRII